MIKQKEMPTAGLVCGKMLDTMVMSHGRAYHIKESVTDVIVYEKGKEVHRDEETKRSEPSG